MASVEHTEAIGVWKMLLAHIPPPEPWTKPIPIRCGLTRLTLSEEGIHVRGIFGGQLLTWSSLDKAVVFRPTSDGHGVWKLKLVLRGRVFRVAGSGTYGGSSNKPTGYDVVDFLAAHAPKGRLVLCATSGPACSVEEAHERKKAIVQGRWPIVIHGFLMEGGCLFFFREALNRLQFLREVLDKGGFFWGVLALLVVLFLMSILCVATSTSFWRELRRREQDLDRDLETLVSGSGPRHSDSEPEKTA